MFELMVQNPWLSAFTILVIIGFVIFGICLFKAAKKQMGWESRTRRTYDDWRKNKK